MKPIDVDSFTRSDQPEVKRRAEGERKAAWWSAANADPGPATWATAAELISSQAYRREENDRWLALHAGVDAQYADLLRLGRRPPRTGKRKKLRFNVVEMVTDTIAAKVAQSSPKPTFLTQRGNFEMKQRAQQLDVFCQGMFHAARFGEVAEEACMDALRVGTLAIKVYPDFNARSPRAERVPVDDLYVDEVDAKYGHPRNLFHVMSVAREVLAACYPEKADAVRDAAGPADVQGANATTAALGDVVQVVEAWHLPSGPGEKDGRHVIAVHNATLVDEVWTRETFPFAFWHWKKRGYGFWAAGVPEELEEIQEEINELLVTIQRTLRMFGPKMWLPTDGGPSPEQLTNEIGGIIKSKLKPELLFAFNALPPQFFDQFQNLVQRAYDRCGVSEMAIAARKPAGLDSGVAQREYNDSQSERFILRSKAWERMHVDAGALFIEAARELDAKLKGGFEVTAPARKFIQRIRWRDVNLEADKYVLKAFPTSSLPTQPAARMQRVVEMRDAGVITPEQAESLLDFPDLDGVANPKAVARRDIEATIAHLLEGGDFQPPEPFQDLAAAIPLFQSAYVQARMDGAGERILAPLRQWMDAAKALLEQAAAPPAPGGAPMTPPDAAAAAGPAPLPLPPGAPPPGALPV